MICKGIYAEPSGKGIYAEPSGKGIYAEPSGKGKNLLIRTFWQKESFFRYPKNIFK